MTTRCPHCNAELEAPDGCIGQEAECSQCGRTFTVRRVPQRIAIPPRATPSKMAQKLEPHQKWILIGLAIVLAIALPCAWFFGFVNRNADELALKQWLLNLPTATTGLEILPGSVSALISSDIDPAKLKPQQALLYPSITGMTPKKCGFLPLHITQTFKLCDMTGVLATCREIPLEQLEDFAHRRDALAFLCRDNHAIGDTISRGVYVYYGIYPIPLENGFKQNLHLFVQTQDDFDAAIEGMHLEEEKQRYAAEIEWQSEIAKSNMIREQEKAERDAERPETTSFLGIRFGSTVPYGDASFTKIKEDDDFIIYSFTPDTPLTYYTDYTVAAHKGTGRIIMIEAQTDNDTLRSLNKRAEIEVLCSHFRDVYKGADESQDDDAIVYVMRDGVKLILDKKTLALTAIDNGLSNTKESTHGQDTNEQ